MLLVSTNTSMFVKCFDIKKQDFVDFSFIIELIYIKSSIRIPFDSRLPQFRIYYSSPWRRHSIYKRNHLHCLTMRLSYDTEKSIVTPRFQWLYLLR